MCAYVCVCAFVCVDSSSQVLSEHQNILNVAVKFTYFLRCGSRYRWEWVCYANGYTFFLPLIKVHTCARAVYREKSSSIKIERV